MGNELIDLMSDEQLIAMREANKAVPSAVTLLNGILESRSKAREEAKVEEAFLEDIKKFSKLHAPPANIYNFCHSWREVEEVDSKAKPEEVTTYIDGKEVKSMRQPTIKSHKWVLELNKGFSTIKQSMPSSSQGSTTNQPSKRAIVVSKRQGDKLVEVGKFPNCQRALDFLKLPNNGNSANRVLAMNGYIIEAYQGTDYTLA